MLAGPRYANGDIERRCDRFAGEPHLSFVICPSGIAGGSGCADGGAKEVRQFVEGGERLGPSEPPAAAYHDVCVL